MSALAIVDGGVAFAQIAPSSDSSTVPAAHDLLGTGISPDSAPVTPRYTVSSGTKSETPATALPPDQFPPEVSPARQPSPASSVSPVTTGDDVLQLRIPADRSAPPTSIPPIDTSNLQREVPNTARPSVDYGSVYIDSTDYSLGATSRPDVVLTERSTGCKTVIRPGQGIPVNICGPVAASGQVVTTYNGRGASPAPVNSVQVGPISIGPGGVRFTSRSVQDYYNRTDRPGAIAGNGNTALMFPLSIPAMITSPFGWRVHPIFGNHRLHTGTDLGAPLGTPIVAAYSGQVAIADFLGGYGLTVVLSHAEAAAQTLYGHMSEIFVKSGEWVEQGEIIGRVGSTGNSTGPHLHFEYRVQTANGWSAVNSGEMLSTALARVHDGFQLAALPNGKAVTLTELSVPEMLLSGKDATKEILPEPIASNKVWEPAEGNRPSR